LDLAKKFKAPEKFIEVSSYNFLPFRFSRFDSRYLLTNEVGEYLFLSNEQFLAFTRHKLKYSEAIYLDLKCKHFLIDSDSDVSIDLLSLKLRTKYQAIKQFTSLHLFVVSLRCDYSCPYCQVSRISENKTQFDMTEETALLGLDFVFKSPSGAIKIEFQGGESLLNFELIRFIVEEASSRNKVEKRDLVFVIATNLSFIDNDVLHFCSEHNIFISTSLDGPQDLHDKNRPRPDKNGYDLTVNGIRNVQRSLGVDKVSALMTTTESSLSRVRDIIDEYISHGFDSIFLRPLSPYGFAVKTKSIHKYNAQRWLDFYKEGMEYIFELNRNGIPFREEYSSIILKKILTPFNPGYVDLQSPAGVAISAIVFNYDGDVYASDESRMLAEMGDKEFKLGSLNNDSYEEIMTSEKILSLLSETMTEGMPMCTDCVFMNYCGSDPVYHYATQKDIIGHKSRSGFCEKNMGVFKYLLGILGEDASRANTLRGWV